MVSSDYLSYLSIHTNFLREFTLLNSDKTVLNNSFPSHICGIMVKSTDIPSSDASDVVKHPVTGLYKLLIQISFTPDTTHRCKYKTLLLSPIQKVIQGYRAKIGLAYDHLRENILRVEVRQIYCLMRSILLLEYRSRESALSAYRIDGTIQ